MVALNMLGKKALNAIEVNHVFVQYFEAPSTASEQSLPVDFECTDNTRGIRGAVASSCPEADTTAVKPAELLDLPNRLSYY